ncbi:MAG: division/cell wall cluster transcriptional repressor MraZ [Desulfotomaculales bacterium]
MFMGEYQHALDSKGRLFIPARFREGLGEKFVLTKGLDGCLFAYPPQEWLSLEDKMKALPFTRSDVRAFVRFFFAGACECEVDRQGRILIPAALRRHASLEKEAVIIGVSSRVEIWALEQWEKYNREAAASVEQIAEKIVDLGFGI